MRDINYPVSKYKVIVKPVCNWEFSLVNIVTRLPKILGALLMILSVTSCFYDEGLPNDISPDEEVSFALDIQPIFTTNCSSCHPAVIASPDLTEGNSYNSIVNGTYIVPNDTEASLLYQRVIGNPSIMPPNGSLPSSEIELIRIWIEQGALDN